MTDDNSSVLSIEVSLAPPPESDVLSPFTSVARPRPDNIEAFYAAPAQLDQAVDELRRLGFRVLIASQLSISVEGSPELFTEVFGTELVTRSTQEEPVAEEHASPVAESFLAPAPEATWEPPAPLVGLVERAYIQPPYLYFESSLPPRVDYHHLRVPGDLALLMNASAVHRQGTTGRGVKVAMIDSGFYIQHPYYLSQKYNMSRVLAPGATTIRHDENGHGTAEAANILAVAPDVTFIGVKAGPNLAASFKATVQQNPDIISVSLGFDLTTSFPQPRSRDDLPLSALPRLLKPLEAEITNAVAMGITVVFSAGNGHIAFPGMHPDVISAGGAFIDEDIKSRASDYASAFRSRIYPGRSVPDVAGLVGMQPHADYIMLPLEPGCTIDQDVSAHDGTGPDDGWSVISGTSAAAPQLAGVCALLKQKNPGLAPAEIREVLKRTARDVTQGHANAASNPVRVNNQVRLEPIQAGLGPDGATGHGLVDAFAAWQQV
jgi:subtilase family serine protease